MPTNTAPPDSFDSFLSRLFQGEKRAISRAISEVENESPDAVRLLDEIYGKTGNAYRIGVTGPPGAGKSTLTNELALYYRSQNKSVAIVAVDPTSPFTGGALLGDRIRMQTSSLDTGVYIRSMAARGSLGGLSKKAKEAADVLDAAGFDIILFETVGVGQSELDIAQAADTTVVVLVPESGDAVQAMKAGLMEIADVFVMNKCDRDGANQAVSALHAILQFRIPGNGGANDGKTGAGNKWLPPVVQTIGAEGKGSKELADAIESHKQWELTSGHFRTARMTQLRERILELVSEQVNARFWTKDKEELMEREITNVASRSISPYKVVESLIKT